MIDETSLIILAGGEGSRMGRLSKITPKPLMAAFDEPLVIRHIRHAEESGIKRIIISTAPTYYDKVKKSLPYWNKNNAILIENENHKDGSLPALLKIMDFLETKKLIMAFSDIFFLKNPYSEFLKTANSYSYVLGISPAFSTKELGFGGIILLNPDLTVRKIRESPIKSNREGMRWNGLVYFNSSHKRLLNKFLQLYPKGSPEGDFFEYLRKKMNAVFHACICPDFINVNKPIDIFIATLYRYAEINPKLRMESMANRVRKNILYKT